MNVKKKKTPQLGSIKTSDGFYVKLTMNQSKLSPRRLAVLIITMTMPSVTGCHRKARTGQSIDKPYFTFIYEFDNILPAYKTNSIQIPDHFAE